MKSIVEKYYYWLLIVVVLIAVLARVLNLTPNSFFGDFDEYYTAKTVIGFYEDKIPDDAVIELEKVQSSSYTDVLKDANRDNGNSFFYNLTLHWFGKLFGNTDNVFRWFSVIFDIVSLLTIASIGRLLKIDRTRILLACIIFALYPLFISFGGIIRTYAFTTSITLLLIRLVISADKSVRPIWSVLSIASLATILFLSHYLTYYILLVVALFFLFNRKILPTHFNRIGIGFTLAGFICGAFLFFNYQGLSTINKRSKNYEEVAKSGHSNSRKLEAITPGLFAKKTAHYLNAYYIGSNTVENRTRVITNEKIAVVVCFVLLLLPVILLFNLKPDLDNRKWVVLFASLFIAGNLSAIALSLLAGHMTSLNPKYSMFSIPFFILVVCFFVKPTIITRAAIAFVLLVSIYTLYYSLGKRALKPINIEMAELSTNEKYLCRDYPKVKEVLDSELQKHRGDTLFVRKVNDLVFIKCAMIDLPYSHAYILENDSSKRFQNRVVDVSFTMPN